MNAIDYYEYFIDNFPESSSVKEAEGIYINVLDELEKLTKNNL
jgi:outer membrane protein assembly factor BamD